MKKILLIIAIALSYNCGMAQTFGEIHGTVLDEMGMTMPDAYITVIAGESELIFATDLYGKFKIKPLKPGIYNLIVSYSGYHDFNKNSIPVTPDDITFLESITLVQSSVMIDMATVESDYIDPLINPNAAMKAIVRFEDIEHSPVAKNLSGLIVSITPGVQTNQDTGELYFRGSRSGGTQYIVDGVKIIGAAPRIPSSGMGSISVYTGGVPAKYGDLTGGVVIIETKNYFDLYNKAKYSKN